jgi:4,5:9,10-diseco-3-hydroxy-5,9,17-trioxoandrosta-1(10),2-diene-4-oate hydrolase
MDASPAGIARWFKGLLSCEGLDRADVLGHSMGGTVAMLLALEAPDLVRRLILVNTGGLCWPAGPLGDEVDKFLRRLVEGEVDEVATRRFAAEVYGWDPDGDRARESARFWMQQGVRSFFAKGGLVYTRPVPVWELRELNTETMLIWGENDRWFPLSTAKEEMMYIPGYRLVVIEGGGHSPFVEAPGLFYLTVDSFLSDRPEDSQ